MIEHAEVQLSVEQPVLKLHAKEQEWMIAHEP
jgi:hypothetical protein